MKTTITTEIKEELLAKQLKEGVDEEEAEEFAIDGNNQLKHLSDKEGWPFFSGKTGETFLEAFNEVLGGCEMFTWGELDDEEFEEMMEEFLAVIKSKVKAGHAKFKIQAKQLRKNLKTVVTTRLTDVDRNFRCQDRYKGLRRYTDNFVEMIAVAPNM